MRHPVPGDLVTGRSTLFPEAGSNPSSLEDIKPLDTRSPWHYIKPGDTAIVLATRGDVLSFGKNGQGRKTYVLTSRGHTGWVWSLNLKVVK